MTKVVRKLGFLTGNLILRWPIYWSLAAARVFKPFHFLFLVYPGSDKDLDGYCPRWLAKSWLFSKKPTIGGVISKGRGVGRIRGLTLVVPNTVDEFRAKSVVCQEVLNRLERMGSLLGVKSIAIAGQVPGIIIQKGFRLNKPFVEGSKGTVFCVIETVDEAAKRHNLSTGKYKIAVVGVGYIGGLLVDVLMEYGHDVIGIDTKTKRERVTSESHPLKQADLVVVLLPKGSDFDPYILYLKKGAIVIDDTHPKIRKKPPGIIFYKVAVGMKGVKFLPRLPGYKSNWIPGCAAEAMCVAFDEKFRHATPREFNGKAKDLGFFAYLDS